MSDDKLMKEFQKYNSDLEKHLPKMDFDFMNNIKDFDTSEPNEEMLALLINTVNDLKIEVALTRKNMADNIEGMVMRVLNNEHNMLVRHVNDMNAKMVANVRDSFSSYITQLNTEFSAIRKDFNNVKIATDNMHEAFKNTNSELSEMNMTTSDFKNIRREINSGIERLNERLDSVDNNVNKLKTELPHIDFKKELNLIKTGIIENRKELNIIKLNANEEKRKLNYIKLDIIDYIKKTEAERKKELNYIKSNNLNNVKDLNQIKIDVIDEKQNSTNNIVINNDVAPKIEDNLFNESIENDNKYNSLIEVQKILSIDERLKKLDSLK